MFTYLLILVYVHAVEEKQQCIRTKTKPPKNLKNNKQEELLAQNKNFFILWRQTYLFDIFSIVFVSMTTKIGETKQEKKKKKIKPSVE